MAESLSAKASDLLSPQHVRMLRLSKVKQDFIAGSFAGLVVVLTGHPLDTIKVRMQMLGTSFPKTVASIVKEEGVLALYKGVKSPLYSSPIVTAISFVSYEMGNRLQGVKPGDSRTLPVALLSGAISGFNFALAATPIDLLKTRLQMEGVGENAKNTKLFPLLKDILRQNGPLGLYKGIGITWLRDVPSIAVQFAAFEQSKILLNRQFGESSFWSFVAGGIGTVIGWMVAYPQDMIKTRIQCSATNLRIRECSREIYSQGGLAGFWKGLSPCLLRAVVTGATRYLVYEKLQEFIGGDRY